MGVDVDETRGDDKARGIDRLAPLERRGGDGLDPPLADTDMADRIETRFRIDDAAIGKNQIEWRFLLAARRQKRQRGQNKRQHQNAPDHSNSPSLHPVRLI